MSLSEPIKKAVKWAGGIAIPAVVTWALEKLSRVFTKWSLTKKLAENKENREALEKAQTKEEREDAAKKITGGF